MQAKDCTRTSQNKRPMQHFSFANVQDDATSKDISSRIRRYFVNQGAHNSNKRPKGPWVAHLRDLMKRNKD
ncbi:hypothetical protein DPMN_043584 [Dreissena polymorpha]|uniref:Uncharacterized protein n=1 Tax=Dreissena polymorpha TaxID=45954 RepID=A0A9D4D0T7_DREPO|nr:hypothetical protein DPMN_043584 [Dreissena polymorpha]